MASGDVLDRTWIGFEAKPRTATVEAGKLRAFALATGESNPIYSDAAAARAAGHPDLPAPPTFVFSLGMGDPAPDIRWDRMGVVQSRVLHAEQSFRHHHQIYAGDEITLISVISDIWDKKGGALEFIAQDTRAVNQRGDLCAEMRTTLVVRNG